MTAASLNPARHPQDTEIGPRLRSDHPIRAVWAANLRIARRGAGLTQRELSELAGLPAVYVARLETAEPVGAQKREAIAAALKLPPTDLFPVPEPETDAPR